MSRKRTYRTFTYREAVFCICCEKFDAVTAEIVRQRRILEDYISRHPEFQKSLEPLELLAGAPEVAQRMARAAKLAGVGPMAAVAGAMAQFAGLAALDAGAREVIVDNGGDIYICAVEPVIIGLKTGTAEVGDRLAFSLKPDDTPISICSSSAAATAVANLVKTVDDIDPALENISSIDDVDGVVIVKGARVGLAGKLPPLVRIK
jgi:ApbE superfamily uncharacterized protein (UPF0280 family)